MEQRSLHEAAHLPGGDRRRATVELTASELARLDEAAPKGSTGRERYPNLSSINR